MVRLQVSGGMYITICFLFPSDIVTNQQFGALPERSDIVNLLGAWGGLQARMARSTTSLDTCPKTSALTLALAITQL